MSNKLLISTAIALCFAATAAFANGTEYAAPAAAPAPSGFNPGVYVGVQGGYVDTGWSSYEGSPDTWFLWSPDTDVSGDTGFAGRGFIGYDAYDWLAFELGYLWVNDKTEITNNHVSNGIPSGSTVSDIRTQAIDLVAKLKSPTYEGFGVYAKAGVGYLMEDGRNNYSNIAGAEDRFFKDDVNEFDLVYGLGLSYTLPTHSNWIFDISWTRYASGHSKLDTEWQPDMDFYAFGLMYKFNVF